MAKATSKRQEVKTAAEPVKATGTNLFAWLDGLEAKQAILLICLLSCLAYANSLGGDFVFDDTEQIVENPDARSWENLGRAFTTHVWQFRDRPGALRAPAPLPYYRPIFTVMLTVEYQLFGLWPQGWHIVSLLLHILCSVGVYYVLLLMSGKKRVAAIAAALFAVYSVHVESVSWISGMTDPLFGVFFLASVCFYLKHRKSNKRSDFVLSLLLFALAAFSKETALSLVVLIFTYETVESVGEKSSWLARGLRAARRAAPYAGVAVLYLIPRYLVLGGLTWKNPQAHQGPFTDTLLTLPWVILSYCAHLLWPVSLSVAYATSFVTSITDARFLAPLAVIVAALGLLFVYRNRISREVWHALALIFVPLLPVLDLRQLSEHYLIFDRYLYLSVAGWCHLIALALAKLAQRQEARALQWSSAITV
ncbi:MAG TPA: hypothetical protein VNO70_16045, partial [Blastocatellia bacterium]|nr:hypothetical protein [Blastocatellia bacterium]